MNIRTDLPDQSPSHSPDWNSRMLTAAGFMGQSVKAVNMFASIRSYNLARSLVEASCDASTSFLSPVCCAHQLPRRFIRTNVLVFLAS